MPSPDILKVLLILLPGFVTTGVIRALTVSPETSEFDKVVRALSYSFLNYGVFSLVRSAKPIPSYLNPAATPLSQPLDIVLLGIIALAMGCLVAAYKNNDWQRFFRKLRLTYRSSRSNIWHDCLVVEGSNYHVIVTLEDERRIMGWLVRYGDDIDNPALFLQDASWLTEDGEIPTANGGILLLAPLKIASVEFVEFLPTEPLSEVPDLPDEDEQPHV